MKAAIGYLCLGEDELKRVRHVSSLFVSLLMDEILGLARVVVLSWWLCLAFHPGLPSYKSYEAQDEISEVGTRPDA